MLHDNCWYVGTTANLKQRATQHFDGCGSAWTKLHEPIMIYEKHAITGPTDERETTLAYMKKYGIDNVRGGPWCECELQESTIDELNKMIDADESKCYECGETGHIAKFCPNSFAVPSAAGGSKKEARHGVERRTTEAEPRVVPTCAYCHKKGHLYRDCFMRAKFKYEQKGRCYTCGDFNHYAYDCPWN